MGGEVARKAAHMVRRQVNQQAFRENQRLLRARGDALEERPPLGEVRADPEGRHRISHGTVDVPADDESPLDRWLSLDRDGVVTALADCFRRRRAAVPGALGDDELADARELAARKYASPAWIDRLT